MNIQASRRDMLKGGGALDRQLLASAARLVTRSRKARAQSRSRSPRWIRSLRSIAKGMVTVYTGKVDLGTGVTTALAADGGRGARRAAAA